MQNLLKKDYKNKDSFVCFFFFIFSFLLPLLLQAILKTWDIFFGPLDCACYMYVSLREKKKPGKTRHYLPVGVIVHRWSEQKLHEWVCFCTATLLLSELNKLSETKNGFWHVITRWPGHLLNECRTQLCYILDRDESLKKRCNLTTLLILVFGITFESFITVTVIQPETREDFNIQLNF